MSVGIRQATAEDIPVLYNFYNQIGKKDEGYFEACFKKDCLILMASISSPVIPLAQASASLHERDLNESGTTAHNTGSPLSNSASQNAGMTIVGFGILNFKPKYGLYQKLNIPEIQDLNVIPEARQKGIATMLVDAFENIVRDQGGESIGISVGLTKDYGAAQRLYCKLGYMPDGYGVTYNREGVTKGQMYSLDDDLALMMVKDLSC